MQTLSYSQRQIQRLSKQAPTVRTGSRCRVIAESTEAHTAPVGAIVHVEYTTASYAHGYDEKSGRPVCQPLSTLRLIKDAHYKAHNR